MHDGGSGHSDGGNAQRQRHAQWQAAGVAVAGAAAGVAAMAMTVATEKRRRREPWRRLVCYRDGVVAAAVADAPPVRVCVW